MRPQKTDYLLISTPDWWTLARSGVCVYAYILPGNCCQTGLDKFWSWWSCIIFRFVTSSWKLCFPGMFYFYISNRHKWCIFQRKMWQANPQRGAFLTQWFPMSLTVWGISKCQQVKLVYIFPSVYCAVFPPRVFIAELICRLKGNLNASLWQQTFVCMFSARIFFFRSNEMVHKALSPGEIWSHVITKLRWEKQIVHNALQNMNAAHFLLLEASEYVLMLCISYLFILPSHAPGNGNCCLYMHVWEFWSMMIFSLLYPRTITKQYRR